MSSSEKVVFAFRSGRTLCVAVALLFFLCIVNLNAQTVIKERIELQPQQGHLQRDNELVCVAEDSGTFAGTVILARKYDPIVTGRLSITRRGTTRSILLRQTLEAVEGHSASTWFYRKMCATLTGKENCTREKYARLA